ncbi:hypothetical protein TNIN_170361 [Trichonephila inaurata madagascariensis]|uniref:Uncharacterized protein n=1 Tax=Trichonephila inaurata madagascariensis TaxID=2747483 RepID=A0A8X6I9K4_9ARAC|nr:hypothetical protein TNIN_170361 [Trichonephila inaurata madagascariensis]
MPRRRTQVPYLPNNEKVLSALGSNNSKCVDTSHTEMSTTLNKNSTAVSRLYITVKNQKFDLGQRSCSEPISMKLFPLKSYNQQQAE